MGRKVHSGPIQLLPNSHYAGIERIGRERKEQPILGTAPAQVQMKVVDGRLIPKIRAFKANSLNLGTYQVNEGRKDERA